MRRFDQTAPPFPYECFQNRQEHIHHFGSTTLLTLFHHSVQSIKNSRMINRVICIFLNVWLLCEAAKRNYLVFGGNGFLGAEIVSLLRLRPGSDISIVNRGNWYWDSTFRIKPFVNHVKCDRYDIMECKSFVKLIEEKKYFDMVYDFSAYRGHHLKVYH